MVGETGDALKVAALVARLKPRILILSPGMPEVSTFEVIHRVREVSSNTAVIVLSAQSHEPYIVQALRTGASGYVVTYARSVELVRAIRKVVSGNRYVSSPLSALPIEAWLERAKSVALDAYETLTRREREVLHLVSQGLTNAGIASRLAISRRTAEVHRASVMQKMNFKGLGELMRYVIAREMFAPSG